MRHFTLLICLIISSLTYGQERGLNPIKKESTVQEGTTRAVVVGISNYQNEGITDLRFADQDAKVFADYLLHPKGLALDSADVQVLLNEDATAGNFISALYGLIENSKEGDQSIIYFAGHGDVESTTISQPGFLLCWDAPSRVYMAGGTFGLNYLQEIVATLSSQIKSKVLVITDACRSGKLAGSDIGGANATAAHMAKQVANEVKIMSCQPQEFSLEGEEWGGGRGVFSYYLMAGIQGMADRNEDQEVTLFELRRYLEDNVVMAVDPHSQVPMTVGSPSTRLAKVNPELLAEVKANMKTSVLTTIKERAAPDASLAMDTSVLKKYEAFNKALEEGHLLKPEANSAWAIFQEIKDHPKLAKYEGLMRRNLAAALQDKAQQAINKYLAADPEELKKRWSFSKDYEEYPTMLRYAADLLGRDHFYFEALMSRSFYFEGVNTRLEGERLNDSLLLKEALLLQDSALYYESSAPYALNEKGYLCVLLDRYSSASTLLDSALIYSPKWILPYTNLAASYNRQRDFTKSLETIKKAYVIDSNQVQVIYNMGLAFEGLGEVEKAIQLYKKGQEIDSNYINTYSQLVKVYFDQGDYKAAESYSLKSLELDPSRAYEAVNLGHIYLKLNDLEKSKVYFDLAQEINPKSLKAYQGQIEYNFHVNNVDEAEKQLLNYTKDYPDDNFAMYLLSSIYASKSDSDQAIKWLSQALKKGFTMKEVLTNDQNFNQLRENKSYQNLIQQYFD